MKRVLIVSDIPSNEDAFGHKRIANALYDYIKSEKGGKIVGLEGPWGSGKSTVISFLVEQLKSDRNIKSIKFDAWAHQGDPLRRGYLETIIQQLREEGWGNQESWIDIQNVFAGSEKTTITTTTPRPTLFGFLFAVSLILVPIGTSLMGKGPDHRTIGILTALAPFWVLVGNFFKSSYKENQEDRGPSWDDWVFVLNKNGEVVISKAKETPNPTSIEFEKHFETIASDVLFENDQRRLILILDNIDRIESEGAKSIWSTLQIFLQEKTAKDKEWFEKIWIIVPYDNKHFSKVFSEDEVEGFFQKSFQLRFSVPMPVLSDWRKYLIDLLKIGLPDHSDEERFSAALAYDHWMSGDQFKSPTPREVKVFVNQLGTLVRQWDDEFPLGHLAYFILCRHSVDLKQSLVSGSVPSPAVQNALKGDLTGSLASLMFNATSDKGKELLLMEPIREGISKRNISQLEKLQIDHKNGFVPILLNLLDYKIDWSRSEIAANIGYCIFGLKSIGEDSPRELNSVKQVLERLSLKVSNWMPISEEVAQGIVYHIRFQGSGEYTLSLLTNVSSSIKSWPHTNHDMQSFVKGLIHIMNEVISKDTALRSIGPFLLNTDLNGWRSVCSLLWEQNNFNLVEMFLPNGIQDILTILAREMRSGMTDSHIQMIEITRITSASSQFNWRIIGDVLNDFVNAFDSNSLDKLALLVRALDQLDLANESRSSAALSRMVQSTGKIYSLARKSIEMPLVVMIHLKYNRGGQHPSAQRNSLIGLQVVKSVLDQEDEAGNLVSLAQHRSGLQDLRKIAEANLEFPLMKKCFEMLTSSEKRLH